MESAVLEQTTTISEHCNRPVRVLYFDHTAMLGGGEIALFNLVRYVDR